MFFYALTSGGPGVCVGGGGEGGGGMKPKPDRQGLL